MAKNTKKFSAKTEALKKENKALHQQLREAKKSIDAIKTGNIDALVIAHKNELKVYTEKTTDKTYRILIEKMHEGAVTLNKSGTILYSNSRFANMVNLPLQKVIGKKFEHFIDVASKEQLEVALQLGREKAVREEVHIYTDNGKVIPVLMSINNLSLHNNLVLSIILTDLTIQNKNQEELKSRARQLEQKNVELESVNMELTAFTYVSSHDLQEPLRKIQNFVSCLIDEEKETLSDQGRKYLQRTYETAKRMRALIDDLLTYSRTKNVDGKFEKTNLNIILDEVKNDLKEVMHEKKATIHATGLRSVNIIRFQFRQLLNNLIGNSLKFSKPSTAPRILIKIRIVAGNKLNNKKLSSKIDYCHISYTDNGIGFDPQYKDRIFEVFQRLHNKDDYKGTGIGLAICRRIVENHNGIIRATGKLNKGARFDIYIPNS